VREVAAGIAGAIDRGDVVVSTQPEQTAVIWYYLGDGFRYATPLGETRNPGVMDWRDALDRLERASPAQTLRPLLERQRAGDRVVVVRPVFHEEEDWQAPWTALVRDRSLEWARALAADRRYVRDVSLALDDENARRFFKPVRGDVYVRRGDG
jgi:mannosyltransferase